ncbi:MAG: FAD-binding protein, partial [Syntrophales bacterium LBB04]|nr:FAD-binding protein [Syntrophales bacterium LBB04]
MDLLMSRREFLMRGAVAALCASAVPMGWARGEDLDRTERAKKVVVVGAGLAGLSAAYRLTEA